MKLDLHTLSFTTAVLVSSMSVGCEDDASDGEKEENTQEKRDKESDGGVATDPVFAVGTGVFDGNASSGYLRVVEELDLAGGELEIEDSIEFAGQSDFGSYDGKVLVASGDAPKITKYEVNDELELVELDFVNFESYGLASAALWNNKLVAEERAYMVNAAAEIIVWDPDDMSIEGTIDLPKPDERPGLDFVTGLADRSSVAVDGKYYLPGYWTDASYAQRSNDSVIIVVDVQSGRVDEVLPVEECPGLDYVTVDDDGMIHFSAWTGGAGTYWVLGTAQTCIATLDPSDLSVETKTFASITGGHEGAAFMYAGGGRFVMSVFDEEEAELDSYLADEATQEDPFTIVGKTVWQLWAYEPKTGTAEPITDVDWNSGAVVHHPLLDGFYSMVPGEGYQTTKVYRVEDAESATEVFNIAGWSFRLFQLR